MTHKMEVFALTGEVIETKLEGKELEQYLANEKAYAKQLADIEADKIAKATAKAAAEGKLAALGLTTDDLRALGL